MLGLVRSKIRRRSLLGLLAICGAVVIYFVAGPARDRRLLVAAEPVVKLADPKATDSKTVDAKSGSPDAKTEAEMKRYSEAITATEVKFDMVPIPGGTYLMGSPDSEPKSKPDEHPQHEVKIEPFWMEEHEVTWDEYEVFMFALDIHRREVNKLEPTPEDKIADTVTRPTKPYTDMTFGMGKEKRPAISMTHYAARMYCQWLSAKTGRYYRLPTEAEWEYACRAGTKTAYSFGDDPKQLGDYAWYFENSKSKYHEVATKKPNPWGLYDMHGNVTEWVLDQYVEDYYKQFAGKTVTEPLSPPLKLYPHVARGGSWDDDADALRSAARRASSKEWKRQDPNIPTSIWYHTDAQFVGFRIIRPLRVPSAEEQAKVWDVGLTPEK